MFAFAKRLAFLLAYPVNVLLLGQVHSPFGTSTVRTPPQSSITSALVEHVRLNWGNTRPHVLRFTPSSSGSRCFPTLLAQHSQSAYPTGLFPCQFRLMTY